MVRARCNRRLPASLRGTPLLLAGMALALFAAFILPARLVAAEPEFGGTCVMGLATGRHIKTDCKVTWEDKEGKSYCFNSDDAKEEFLKDPEGNLARARETFAAGNAEATGSDMGRFTPDEARAVVEAHVNELARANDGLVPIVDPLHARTLRLKFQSVEFVRTLHGYGFFPNTNFTDPENEAKRYQIDFWVKPQAGKLAIVETRIYKAPRREGDGWIMITRQPKPWWWIPASEHPGESEVKRGWEVMSALHAHIIAEQTKGGGVYLAKDDKTGEEIRMEFVGIHQPVRKLKEDGRYFACTDFRREGTSDQFYDIDFWLDEKVGKITVGGVRVHKVPMLEDGNFVQMPRYSFDPKTFDVVP